MKRLIFILLLLPITLLAKQPFVMTYFNSYPPYSWQENGVMKGILVDIATQALEQRMKLQVRHEGYPWARAQLRVKQQRADAFITVPTPERAAYTLFSQQTVLPVSFSLLVNKNNMHLNKLQKILRIEELSLFNQVSYLGNGWAKLKLTNMKITWVPTIDRVLQLMANNRYDLFVEATHAINYYIKQSGYGAVLRSIPVPFEPVKFHLCLGKNSPYRNIMAQFDATIQAMHNDGSLERIYAKYRSKPGIID